MPSSHLPSGSAAGMDRPMSTPPTAVWWVRRDLRLADNPALRAAIDDNEAVLPLFVLDPVLLRTAGTARRAWMTAALTALDARVRDAGGPGLSVVRGRPAEVVPQVARDVGADRVHVSADFGPYGRRRDERVEKALAGSGAELVRTGSPYAVAPGTLSTQSGGPFQVFTPFHRAWQAHGVHDPAPSVRAGSVTWVAADQRCDLEEADPQLVDLADEAAARRAWKRWLGKDTEGVSDYATLHDFPGPDGTSHLSIALRWGHLHPRTVLADLAPLRSKGAAALARQLAWRDFFADVLWHRPDAVSAPIRPEFAAMTTDEPGRTHAPPSGSRRGSRAVPGIRWSTPVCGSCSPKAGCTTACGW